MIRDMGWEFGLLHASTMWTRFHFTFMLCHLDRHRRDTKHLTDIDFERFDFTQRSSTSLTRMHTVDDAMMWMFHLTERLPLMSLLPTRLFARRLAGGTLFLKTVRRWGQMA
ncbi:hypothetical protein AA904_16390, partial [Geobacillus stearothermophilus]